MHTSFQTHLFISTFSNFCHNTPLRSIVYFHNSVQTMVQMFICFSFLCNVLYRVITVFTVFRLLTDFVCLYTYEFWLSLWKIVLSSVILLLPLFIVHHCLSFLIVLSVLRRFKTSDYPRWYWQQFLQIRYICFHDRVVGI